MSCNESVASKNTIRYSLSPASFLDELFKEDNQCQGQMLMNPENAMYTCKKCKIELMLSDCNSKKCVVKELFKQQLLQNQCRDMKAECERCKRVYHTCPYLDCNKYALADHKSKPGDSYKFRCIQRHLETHKQDRKKKRSRSKDDSLDQDISSAGLFFADALNNLEMCKKQIQSITYCFDQCMKDLSHSQLLNCLGTRLRNDSCIGKIYDAKSTDDPIQFEPSFISSCKEICDDLSKRPMTYKEDDFIRFVHVFKEMIIPKFINYFSLSILEEMFDKHVNHAPSRKGGARNSRNQKTNNDSSIFGNFHDIIKELHGTSEYQTALSEIVTSYLQDHEPGFLNGESLHLQVLKNMKTNSIDQEERFTLILSSVYKVYHDILNAILRGLISGEYFDKKEGKLIAVYRNKLQLSMNFQLGLSINVAEPKALSEQPRKRQRIIKQT